MRRVSLIAPRERGAGGEPSRVASHDLHNRDWRCAAHSLGVAARTHDGQRDEPGRAAVSGTVIGENQVVVYGLGHVDHAEIVAPLVGQGLERVARLSRVVAADDEPVADAEPVHVLEYWRYVLIAQPASRRADSRAGRVRHALPLRLGHLGQVDAPAFEQSLEPMRRAEQNASPVPENSDASPYRLRLRTFVQPPDCITSAFRRLDTISKWTRKRWATTCPSWRLGP